MASLPPEIIGRVFEPLGVSPRQTGQLLNIRQTRVWHLIGAGELETYWEGRCRKVTLRSIRARHERQLAAARGAVTTETAEPRRGRPPKSIKTCLSVALTCAMPVWAALCASGVKNHAPPPEATHVAICTHHGVNFTGERVAQGAARGLAESRVRVATSPEPGTNFNDVLTGRAATKGNEARHASPNAIGIQVRGLIGAAPEITQCDTWPAPDMPSLDDDTLAAGWKAWITAGAAARACPRNYAAARIGVASAWIGNAGRIAAAADRLDNAAELCCSRPSLGRAFSDSAPV